MSIFEDIGNVLSKITPIGWFGNAIKEKLEADRTMASLQPAKIPDLLKHKYYFIIYKLPTKFILEMWKLDRNVIADIEKTEHIGITQTGTNLDLFYDAPDFNDVLLAIPRLNKANQGEVFYKKFSYGQGDYQNDSDLAEKCAKEAYKIWDFEYPEIEARQKELAAEITAGNEALAKAKGEYKPGLLNPEVPPIPNLMPDWLKWSLIGGGALIGGILLLNIVRAIRGK